MDNTIDEPRIVAAGRGSAWWGRSWRLLTSNFFTWIGMVIIYYIISALLSLVPIVGSIGQVLLTPVFIGGIMLGCQAIERDGALRIAHLFEGFQGEHFVPLMIIGAINIGFFAALALLGTVGIFGVFAGMAYAPMMAADPLTAITGSMRNITGTGLLMGLVMFVLGTAFAMLNWFAPALVALHGARSWAAMRASFTACLRNWAPFLVYGLIALAVVVVLGGLLVAAALGIVAGAAHEIGGGTGLAAMLVFFGVLAIAAAVVGTIVGPLVFASTYAAYSDIFTATDKTLPNPAYR